ncbi:high affinity immunoglobulin gamma Fc receptor I-like [Bufo gargarizans]|uniref:high affinity immunoglobulin gamma Fc receptor I-like n=1 Tax=Bufo gargarizans TaxID=30331 RepID=UPI001CF2F2C2|nr:high affinity immunoglobulin gamma Fc receptor I-like [Bufo gargarizans]XP_044128209.1 high affinity immunoglobulin gamma Fc receptor I-like [Bufo gargarizans]
MAFLLHGRCSLAPLIIFLSVIVGLSGAAVRPVVTFTPPWNKILPGEAVRMTCDVDTTEQGDITYTWYRNNKWTNTGKSLIILPTQSRHGGSYQCGTSEDNISEAVTLNVTKGPVVLQAPPYIYEGDDLPLRCYSGSRNTAGPIVFYRNNTMINPSTTDPEILVRDHRDETAVYKCEKQVIDYTTHSDETVLTDRGAAASFVVTFYPNWRKIFTGESITMYCNREHYGTYSWYKDWRLLENIDQNFLTIQSAQRHDSGRYQCGTRYVLSPAVSLDVSDGPVILQAPLFVHDGDDIKLRCHSRPEYSVEWTKFLKDDKLLQDSGDETINLRQGDVTGRYRCERRLSRKPVSYTDSVSVPIRELFSRPEIRLTPSNITEGDDMTLTCDTRLSPYRQSTELQFAFYRDGSEVQGFTTSDRYEVLSAQLEDSGNYSCTGRTSDGRVWKPSQELDVHLEGGRKEKRDFMVMNIIRLIMSGLIVVIGAVIVIHHLKSRAADPQKKGQGRG